MEIEKIQMLQRIALTCARIHCSFHNLIEDAASEAMIRMLKDLDKYDPSRCKLNTFLGNSARYGIKEFLRQELGRHHRKPHIDACSYDDIPNGVASDGAVSADTLLHIARRCDNIDKAPLVLTLAQRRGNVPMGYRR